MYILTYRKKKIYIYIYIYIYGKYENIYSKDIKSLNKLYLTSSIY